LAGGLGEPLLVDVVSAHVQLGPHLLGGASTLLALPRLAPGIEELCDIGIHPLRPTATSPASRRGNLTPARQSTREGGGVGGFPLSRE
jgi:hypothetical protein